MMKIHHIDHGLARVVYIGANPKGERIYYAIQEKEDNSFTIYRLCQKFEAQGKAFSRKPLCAVFEQPIHNTPLSFNVCKFIQGTQP